MEDLPYGLLLERVYEYRQKHTAPSKQFIQKSGHQEIRKFALKGSLVVAISHMPSVSGANYRTLSKPSISLHCRIQQVHKLTEQQKDLLEGVEHLQDRTEVLHKLDWVQNLRVNYLVHVAIPTIPKPVKAVIQYIGKLPEEKGTKFGLELNERRGEGTSDGKYRGERFFHCDPYCAVFVSMDPLTRNTVETSAAHDRPFYVGKDPVSTSNYLSLKKGSTDFDTKAFGIFDNKTLVKQKTELQKIERRQIITMKQSEQHQRIQEAKKKLNLVDSLSLDSSMLDSEKQRRILEDAVQESKKQESSSSNENPNNLMMGSMVQFGNPPCYGIMKWIGYLPPAECVMAGVELEKTEDDVANKYTDGRHNSIQLFQSKPNRGLFLPLSGLHSDKRHCNSLSSDYGSMTLTSPVDSTEASLDSLQVADVEVQTGAVKVVDANIQTNQLQTNDATVQTKQYSTVDASVKIHPLQNDSAIVEKLHLDLENMKTHFEEQLKNAIIEVQQSNEELKANLQEQLSLTQNQLSLAQQQLVGLQAMITSSRLWVVSRKEIKLGKEIGRGAWAIVYRATFRGTTVAVKSLHDAINAPKTKELFQREMNMALQCQHENIVTFLGATMDHSPVILMEMMDINLRKAYEQESVKDHQIPSIFHDVAKALHFLHTRPDPVIHRDVSSVNVLLKEFYNGEWLAKLGDLGTAKIQQQIATAGPGAIAYGAPEAGDYTKHSPKMDVYSFGVVVIETISKTHPFQMINSLKTLIRDQYPQYDQLVTNCTKQQSCDRPTMYDVLVQLDEIAATAAKN